MAGSYKHVVDDEGKLLGPQGVNDMLENGGDVYEAVEEMYGMIWVLAAQLSASMKIPADPLVELARQAYSLGLQVSPSNKKPHG